MIAAIAALALGGILFVEQEIPGLPFGWSLYAGPSLGHCRQADLDHNGYTDLILDKQVFFQQGGLFVVDAPAPTPGADRGAACDVWGDTIFLRDEQGLELLVWRDGAWETVLEQEVDWPAPVAVTPPDLTAGRAPGVAFERFLHDIDANGTPEIVVPAEDGIHIFEKRETEYQDVARLDVLPRLEFAPRPDVLLWPPEARRIAWPAREMGCRFSLEGNRLWVVSPESLPGARVRYRITRFALDVENGYRLVEEKTSQDFSDATPADPLMQPFRLNSDETMDFVRQDTYTSEASVLPVPICETQASTDGGRSFQRARNVAFLRAWGGSYVDFDGDGDMDMITHTTGLFDGGVRESVTRLLTSPVIEHEVGVHLQDADGRFSQTPDVRGRFTLRLDAAPFRSDLFWQYRVGLMIDLTLDLDGDGRCDLIVHDRPDRLAVHLNRGRAFSKEAAATIRMPRESTFVVVDVDADGRNDIVVGWHESRGGKTVHRFRVHLNRGKAP